ncbi:MAG: arsenic efflux protein, partial [Clostridia bacterium]|nr:arsenic efflux protein [Clostridia bacterium]
MELLHILYHSLSHPFVEAIKMAPILFLAYLFMEWLEHTGNSKLTSFVKQSKRFGPLFSSFLGLVPQCGFSGAVAGMYAAGTVTVGTLFAVILATSDEMLPMMLSAKLPLTLISSILVAKLVSGIITGFAADLVLKKHKDEQNEHIHEFCE